MDMQRRLRLSALVVTFCALGSLSSYSDVSVAEEACSTPMKETCGYCFVDGIQGCQSIAAPGCTAVSYQCYYPVPDCGSMLGFCYYQ